jgi:predicted ATP-dependent Lon-type protease
LLAHPDIVKPARHTDVANHFNFIEQLLAEYLREVGWNSFEPIVEHLSALAEESRVRDAISQSLGDISLSISLDAGRLSTQRSLDAGC